MTALIHHQPRDEHAARVLRTRRPLGIETVADWRAVQVAANPRKNGERS